MREADQALGPVVMALNFSFRRRGGADGPASADTLHDALIAVVRQPVFYLERGVPDTFEGRFDLLVLHAALVLRRLRDLGDDGSELAQALTDLMFRRFDIAMRELGVSDIAVPKRMKRLAEAFKGRTAAYDEGLREPDLGRLAQAIGRNVLNDESRGRDLAVYVADAAVRLQTTTLDALRAGDLPFPPQGLTR